MSNPEMSAVERYLMSDEARENVKTHLAPTRSQISKEGWAKDERGPWEAGTYLSGAPFRDGAKWMLSFNDSGLWFDAWADDEPKVEVA